jgi:hypothetical protein
MTWPDSWGPGVSERGKKRSVSVWAGFLGHRLFSILGRFVALGPFVYFFLLSSFPFLFSISFISFSNLVQIDSNQFVNFSKIQINIPE